MAIQLTDDGIDDILQDIVDYFERTPLTFFENCEMTDEGYDHFAFFFRGLLEPYSNGYRNYN